MSVESQRSIADWAYKEFGKPRAAGITVARTLEEVNELVAAINEFAERPEPGCAAEEAMMYEIADCIIVFNWLADFLGYDLSITVDEKMEVNRSRRWIAHGDGTGHHVKETDND